jgi:hypothetical protein
VNIFAALEPTSRGHTRSMRVGLSPGVHELRGDSFSGALRDCVISAALAKGRIIRTADRFHDPVREVIHVVLPHDDSAVA